MYQDIRTLKDLIEYLEEFADMVEDEHGNSILDLPVVVAHQKNWPLAERIEAVTICDYGGRSAVWIAASPEYGLGYAPKAAWNGGVEGIDWESSDFDE